MSYPRIVETPDQPETRHLATEELDDLTYTGPRSGLLPKPRHVRPMDELNWIIPILVIAACAVIGLGAAWIVGVMGWMW